MYRHSDSGAETYDGTRLWINRRAVTAALVLVLLLWDGETDGQTPDRCF